MSITQNERTRLGEFDHQGPQYASARGIGKWTRRRTLLFVTGLALLTWMGTALATFGML